MQCSIYTTQDRYTNSGLCSRLAVQALLQCSCSWSLELKHDLYALCRLPLFPEMSWRSHSWLWKFVAMETTLTLPHFIPGKRAGETSINTDTEVGLKETAHNLVGCFNNEAKANYQESPAVFTGKRASVVEEAEEKMGESAIHWFLGSGFYLSLGPAKVAMKKKKKNKETKCSNYLSRHFDDFWSFAPNAWHSEFLHRWLRYSKRKKEVK